VQAETLLVGQETMRSVIKVVVGSLQSVLSNQAGDNDVWGHLHPPPACST